VIQNRSGLALIGLCAAVSVAIAAVGLWMLNSGKQATRQELVAIVTAGAYTVVLYALLWSVRKR
jgi:hypothetical protein